jgi:Carboxypeptidase regulatory-like domain/TonB dependent receptor
MNKKFVRTTIEMLVLICFSILIMQTSIKAQIGGSGTINGTVFDPTGAVVPAATVVAKNVATGVETTRQTTDAGLYVITPLPPGEYKVIVSVKGFQKLIQEKVIVDALSNVSVNLTLKAGDISETVTVESAPPQLNTTDARLGTTIRNELYTNLPLAMGTAVAGSGIGQGPRNPGAFIFLLPGVTEGNRWGQVNGAQGFSKDVFIEGVPITDPIQQGEGRTIALSVSVESVEQFQVETSGTGVEFNGQGSENYSIKSGGNKFHGSGFEYLRNTSLNARGFFPNIRPVEHQNEFGFTVGGPIIKDKLFFFTSYDGWRYRVTTPTQLVSIPTLKERQGDFSELPVAIFDPLSTVCVAGVCTRTQFSDPTRATASNPLGLNIIPLNRISAISQVYQAPLPTPTSTGIANNYLGQLPVGYDNNSFNLKIDYNLTNSQRISGIYTYGKRSQSGPYREVSTAFPQSALPLPYTDTRFVTEIPKVFQLKHSWSVTPNLINQLSFGYNHFFVPITNATSDGKWAAKSGIKGLPAGDASDAFLEAAFAGPNAPAGFRALNSRDFEDNNFNYTIQDSILWVRGKHSFKFGFQYQRTKDKTKTNDTGSLFVANFSNNQTAGFNANSSTLNTNTGNSYASFLLGALNTATVNEDSIIATVAKFSSYSGWVADDYKVSSKLTLNLGLRYDYMRPYTEEGNHFTYLDPYAPNPAAGGRPGVLRFGGNYAPSAISCNCSQIINTYPYAIGPRVGFAYALTDKTVVRGGYGIMYTRRGAVGGRENARVGTGFVGINANAPLAATTSYDPAFYWQNGIPAYAKGPIYDETYQSGFATGRGAGGTMTYGDPNSQPPRYQNWNLSIQRSLTSSLVVNAAYVGSNGKQLAGAGHGTWSNQIDPKYLVLGNLLNATATPANITLAQAILSGVALPFATFSGTIAQMLRPFPQYGGIADPYGNVGQTNYHALQVSLQQRLSKGFTFNANYTFSKALGNIFGVRSAYIGSWDKSLSNTDMPHVFNTFFSYELPFGKGRMFNVDNKVVSAVLSGWQVSGISRFASGTPLGPFVGAACSVSTMGTCYASYNPAFTGSVRINGDWGNGDVKAAVANATPFIDKNAFISSAAFTYGNTPVFGAYGLRNPHLLNTDLNISRNFKVRENIKFVFGADAFNILNYVRFGGINTNITSAAFGKVTSQTNLPRVVQFKFRIEM